MMINKITSNNNKTTFGSKPKLLEAGLEKAAKGNAIHQRLALGAAALAFQPIIDLSNKEIDEETRKVSAVRSAAKAIIGTATGVVVRGATIALGKKLFKKPEDVSKIFGKQIAEFSLNKEAIERIPTAVGTLAGLAVMMFSNFLVDAPLVNLAMAKINEAMDTDKPEKEMNTDA